MHVGAAFDRGPSLKLEVLHVCIALGQTMMTGDIFNKSHVVGFVFSLCAWIQRQLPRGHLLPKLLSINFNHNADV